MHPDWLSNAFLVADEEGGTAVYVDSGAPLQPLRAAAERWRVEPKLVLRTHAHHDHVEHEAELGLPVRTDAVEIAGLRVEALPTPGHSDETTIGREWEENPFVRVWRGVEPEGTEPCRVGGEEATLIVWSPDYDGGGKAWVRFDDGRDAIVGGSRVER